MIFCSGKSWRSIFFKSTVFSPSTSFLPLFTSFYPAFHNLYRCSTKNDEKYDFMGDYYQKRQIFKYFRYESKKGSVIHKKRIARSLLVPYFPITWHYNFWDKLSLSNRDFMTTYSAIKPQDSPFLKQFKKFFDLSNATSKDL